MPLGWPWRWLSTNKPCEQVPYLLPCAAGWRCQPRTHTRKQGQWCCDRQAHASNSGGVLLTLSRAQAAEWRWRGTGAAVPLTAGRVHFIESVCRMLTSPTSWLLRRPLHWSRLASVSWELGCGRP